MFCWWIKILNGRIKKFTNIFYNHPCIVTKYVYTCIMFIYFIKRLLKKLLHIKLKYNKNLILLRFILRIKSVLLLDVLYVKKYNKYVIIIIQYIILFISIKMIR